MSVGAFAFMGIQIVERRFGRRNFLVAMPSLLPMTFKKTFLGLYIRDVIFYVVLLIIPLTLGLIFSVPITNFSIPSSLHPITMSGHNCCSRVQESRHM